MTPSNVLSTCTQYGFTLVADGSRLFLDGDLSKVTDDLAAAIREHKAELLALLVKQAANHPDHTTAVSPAPATTTQAAPEAATWQSDTTPLVGQPVTTNGATEGGGLPMPWLDGLARLQSMRAPPDITPQRWRGIQDAAGVFADRWARQAHSLGWSVQEVFGCHQAAPSKRFDHQGLLWAMSDPASTLVELTSDLATFQVGRNRVTQRMRRDEVFTHEQRLLWESTVEIHEDI